MLTNVINDEPILSGNFSYHKTKIQLKINLHSNFIKIYRVNDHLDKTIELNDLVGCSIGRSTLKNDHKSYLTLYTYPKANSKKHNKRKRVVIELVQSACQTFDENLFEIREWSNEIGKCLNRSNDSEDNRPFLVFVNPNAGAGKAKILFQERILPVWAEANIPFKYVQTEYANYAREQIQSTNLNQYKGILIVSGDGLVFEVINGLMARDDWQEAIRTPIGQLPGGSGNALACCVSYLAKEEYLNLSLESFAMHSAFLTSKHDILPMDLIGIQVRKTNSIVYSFLSIEWALIADVDSESEKYRFLGGLRFTVGAIRRILNLRIYRGRISFLPCGEVKFKDTSIKLLRKCKPCACESLTQVQSKINFQHLRPFNESLPNEWITIEENFVFFLILNLPLIAKDFNASPESKFDDNQLRLVFIKEGITRVELLTLFGETESGNYLNDSRVESIAIKAFRIEPLTDKGCLMIDGEHVPYGPIQGEVLPSIANVIAKRNESN